MKHTRELTLQDLMQMSHDIEEMQKDFDMVMEFMKNDEKGVKAFFKK